MSHRGQLQCLNDSTPYHSHSTSPTSSSPHTPVPKMASPQRSASQDSASEGLRKRVGKACDRCRLKKSKCDGSHPCSRCKADNAICVFGERKKSHDKVYPKGYVEMLEQQQSQLVSGLQEMYKRLRTAGAWSADELAEANGHPLTHDILAALDLLESKNDGSGEMEAFEEDCGKLQSKLISEGAGYTHRRGSFSSESDQSQGHTRSASRSTPNLTKAGVFKDDFNFSAPPTPPGSEHSPGPISNHRTSFPATQPSPLQQESPLSNDPQFYQAEWAYPGAANQELLFRSKFPLQSPELDQGLINTSDMPTYGQWDASTESHDTKLDLNIPGTTFYQNYPVYGDLSKMPDTTMSMDPMVDVEFNQFLSILT